MTEAEWLACTKPVEMLNDVANRASARKVRLFVCVCCRQHWARLTDPRSRRAVEVAERHADGEATDAELNQAGWAAEDYFSGTCVYGTSTGDQPARAAVAAAFQPASLIPRMYHLSYRFLSEEWPAHVLLLRDLFDDLFRPASAEPTWRTSTVVAVARRAYDDRAFDGLPILTDALLDAGCEDEHLLDHCRSPGPHVRGCWALDLVLGKA